MVAGVPAEVAAVTAFKVKFPSVSASVSAGLSVAHVAVGAVQW